MEHSSLENGQKRARREAAAGFCQSIGTSVRKPPQFLHLKISRVNLKVSDFWAWEADTLAGVALQRVLVKSDFSSFN